MTSNALWLEGWEVHDIQHRDGETSVFASYLPEPKHCQKCGVVERLYRHGSKTVDYRDTPAFGAKMVIHATVSRWRCRECGGTSMQPLPDMDTTRRMTRRCVTFIQEQGIAQTYAGVARLVGLDEKTVRNICEEHLRRELDRREVTAPLILGIDDSHLDFRISVLKQDGMIFFGTWVRTKNRFGRFYLTLIMPFHILIVRNAVGRV